MAGVSVKITGLEELKKRIQQAPKRIQAEIGAEVQVSVEAMRGRAIQEAPADQGILRAEIQKTGSGTNWSLFSNAIYSGYVEFGTKSKVQIPPGLSEVATQLRGKGTSSIDAKAAIFRWCKSKGIEEKAWYPIFIKLMVEGMRAQPFFFKQLDTEKPNLLKNIENVLKDI